MYLIIIIIIAFIHILHDSDMYITGLNMYAFMNVILKDPFVTGTHRNVLKLRQPAGLFGQALERKSKKCLLKS